MVDVSVILITARPEFSIIGLPELDMLANIENCLKRQTFKEFELIVVDTLYDRRIHSFAGLPFEVKHVPVHPKHRIWIDRKRYNICGALNTALMYAEGELIVRVDDCSEFDEEYLQRIWDEYETGLWLQGMHVKYLNGKIAVDANGVISQDSRIPITESHGGRCLGPHEWMYGYATFPMEAAIKVNGLIKCNYAIYLLSRIKNVWRANTVKLSKEDIAFIKDETLRPPCSTPNHTYADNCEGQLFQLWIDSQHLFDLRERKLEV